VQVTGIPVGPTAGSTVCLTVTGAVGALKAVGRGSIQVLSVTQTGTRPAVWQVCVLLGSGKGVLYTEAGAALAVTTLVGR
jgi:hypothetical protein